MVCGDGGVSFLATKDRSCRSVGMDECFFSHKGQELQECGMGECLF